MFLFLTLCFLYTVTAVLCTIQFKFLIMIFIVIYDHPLMNKFEATFSQMNSVLKWLSRSSSCIEHELHLSHAVS